MAASSSRDSIASLRTPAYVFLIVSLLLQVMDFIVASAPFYYKASAWRFSFMGSVSAAVGTMLLMVLLWLVIALLFNDGKMLAAIGVITAALSVTLALGSAGFVLDALQVRSTVQPGAIREFNALAGQSITKLVLYLLVCALTAIAAFRGWNQTRRTNRENARLGRSSDDALFGRSTRSGLVISSDDVPARGKPSKSD